MVNRILFYIRKKLKRCYSCNTKVHGTIWDKDGEMILPPSNGGIAHIRDHGWGYVCIPCMLRDWVRKD